MALDNKGRQGKRGPKKFGYTYAQIGELVGLKPRTVAVHAGNGTFDPTDLHSLVEYINMHTAWDGTPRGGFGRSEMSTSHGEHAKNYARVMDRELADQAKKASRSWDGWSPVPLTDEDMKAARKEIKRPEVAEVIAELDTALKEEFPELEMHLVPGQEEANAAFQDTLGKGDVMASFQALISTATAHCDECNTNVLADTLVVGCIGLDEKRLCGECKERSDSYGS